MQFDLFVYGTQDRLAERSLLRRAYLGEDLAINDVNIVCTSMPLKRRRNSGHGDGNDREIKGNR